MQPAKTITFSRLLRSRMLLMVTISTLLTGFFWISQETVRFQNSLVEMREHLITERRKQMQSVVDGAVAYVEFMRDQTEERTRKVLKERVDEAYQLVMNLYDNFAANKSTKEIEHLIREALRPIRFHDGRGYYFATRLDGVEQLCAECVSLEQQNLMEFRDSQGATVIKDMVDLVQQRGEGFYEYTWAKPNSAGQNHRKVSYIKQLLPLNWLIGTGEYFEDIEKDLQKEALNWIRTIRYGYDGYIFAGDWNGVSLAGPVVGKNMIGITDLNGVKIVEKMIDLAKHGGGFFEYTMPPLDERRAQPKISYVRGVGNWHWYLGADMYIDDIEMAVEANQARARDILIRNIVIICIILALLWLGVFALVSRFNAGVQSMLAACTRLLRHNENTPTAGLQVAAIPIKEFQDLAQAADRIISDRNSAISSLFEKSEELERYFNLSLDLLCIADTQGHFLRVNPEWEKVIGYSIVELENIRFLDLVHPEDVPATLKAMAALDDNQEANSFENRYRCRDGTYRWFEWRARPPQNQLIYAAARDITQRKKGELELRTSNELLSAFIHNSPIYAFIKEVDATGSRTLYASENYVDMVGVPGSQMVGKTMEELFPAEFAAKITADDQHVVQSGEIVKLDEELDGRSYTTIKFSIRVGGKKYLAGYTIDLTDRKQAEMALAESEETFRNIVQSSPMGIHLYELRDGELVFTGSNPAADKILHIDNRSFIGLSIEEAFPPLAATEIPERYRRCAEQGESWQNEQVTYQDTQITGAFEVYVFQMSPGRIAVLFNDITPRKQAEEERGQLQVQLIQAQKMESVGRLAGGVAHDFNNMLGVILGHSELALKQLSPEHPVYKGLLNISKAAERSAELTRQLLAFARKQTVSPKTLHLNETVEGMLSMLQRLVGEDMDLLWLPGAEKAAVKIDPSQIDQILVNLIVNARDAIDFNGKIIIETRMVNIDANYCRNRAECVPGAYVQLTVSDTGHGMDEQTKAHIFEPFFTTKQSGKGTGLGLATVYGIVKQNKGFVNVYSEPEKGTTIKVYLPGSDVATDFDEKKAAVDAPLQGTETILLVEDEAQILELTRKMLEELGYTVLVAATPNQAISIAEKMDNGIDLLLTDVVMPEMHGRALAEKLTAMHPRMQTLFMSGYTADVIAHHGILDENIFFIEKPFGSSELSRKLRETLANVFDEEKNMQRLV
jgi:two-component system cell cycle sensor histidine kinase/response regulator CckA